ncbi:dimethyl sulfoxide reductase anchor subunit family protein [Shimwellia blattae]|uniref:Putative dimethyl sulfoxide reductase chain C protein n=1 Tax=Shimwellia blattae (strain ATCC 29907 / DSM 4481 / JCM 1650 / NBRC 105725 / CDC 9005-74) TaxID=630626 RepID=I2B616_SHIBC|nr:DmsC/YnfH family molybdoenzyme membrane anchor subunit [Shimwellia blattae]AFJ45970.1 putative dimethyl sulfoxide reductase chain C protein [Shimwellia blattae DSM 4481 = NBRC 105725]GAB81725.1 anaerobic dimethyl sulfoxide reductase subunit C [Shimwellia blattae DSM 4481 = NBRC 105725]VDY63446.1 DMSO reductase anchor subunit [Shimwellia blattae]VEC21347.1 DMSO reductase anchor subunit [Shimwellia blattae]
MHELPLVFFTVLTQMVAGSFILLTILTLTSPALSDGSYQAMNKLLLCLWGILCIAGMASIAHVGQPLRITNALIGITHFSPMSIEIISVGGFGALGALMIATQWKTGKVILPIMLVVCGVALWVLWAIAHVYQLSGVALWNTSWTTINFIFSGFLSGSALIGVLLRYFYINFLSQNKIIYFIWYSLALLMLGLSAGYFLHINDQLSVLGIVLPPWLMVLQIIRVLLIGSALLFFIGSRWEKRIQKVSIFSLVAVIVAELLGRIFFYELLLLAQL